MNRSTVADRSQLEWIEQQYQSWREDRASVDPSWQIFFEGFDLGYDRSGEGAGRTQAGVTRLIDRYREIGHYLADLDPLRLSPPLESHELLELDAFGLDQSDLDRTFYTALTPTHRATLRDLIAILKDTYCRSIGVEYMHIQNPKVRGWIQERIEPTRNRPQFDLKKKRRIVYKLYAAELFETFLHGHYIGQKRFSLEGGESLIPLLDAIIERAASTNVREIVIGMPHRGRLNVLANTLDKPYGMIFSEFEDLVNPAGGDGDVKYHLGFSHEHVSADGRKVHLSLTPNPSHLEAVNPVVEGRVRAKQRRFRDKDRKLGMPILIHGDAAFAGQGLVAETLNLSQLPGYRTGGTIHVVVNNQIGFTTAPADARSTRYCTDVAKMIEVPIFHVNGDDPEAVVHVAELAADFRQAFGQDVVIDMVCYRKHGHNEGDEPGFTQPVMYDRIRNHESVRTLYSRKLSESGELTADEADTIRETFEERLQAVFLEVHERKKASRPPGGFGGAWAGLQPNYRHEPIETGASMEHLAAVAKSQVSYPEGFRVNPKVQRILAVRAAAFEAGGPIDWGFGEALAFGTLMLEGTPVRLSGQDTRRGTFSHRHAYLYDTENNGRYVPLNHMAGGQAELCIYDSLLSEAAVLGFDYGYSLDEPHMLILWEAQFGDFSNGAQVIIDQFIAAGESKWGRSSGLVMLLPHGYEGQGPEHSSARLERFLQLCAEDNLQVANATTPAQFFHLLRRQMRRDFRKPLVVMTPKSLLRHKGAVSTLDEFRAGHFREVLDDAVDPAGVRRVVVCSGKVYYDLLAQRETAGKQREVALVRLEQLYPWPEGPLQAALGRYRNAREFVWAQEESQNMGGWTFAAPRLAQLGRGRFEYVGRDASASPATGSHHVHDREQNELVTAAIGSAVPHLVTANGHSGPAVALTGEGAH
ncbi:MAG: 2-oxoglutarate dehydrogenase E1 component [Isosphaeraceae bacterium]